MGHQVIHLRTLADPTIGTFTAFNPNHFCETAADGTPCNSSHTLRNGDGWIGHIFKGFPDELWQCQLSGQDKVQGAWRQFDKALSQLWEWHKQAIMEDNEEWTKLGLSPKELPSGTLALIPTTGSCVILRVPRAIANDPKLKASPNLISKAVGEVKIHE